MTVSPAIAKTVKYTWMVSDDNVSFSEVKNSDSASFVIPEGYAGKYVKVRTTGLKAFDGSVESSSVQIASTDAVKITNLEINEIWSESSIGQTKFSIVDDTQAILETGKIANHSATVNKITAGSWSGTFNWTISVKGKEVQDSTN